MRQAQVRYFKERTRSALKESKELEQDVDARLSFLMVQRGIHPTQAALPLDQKPSWPT
jgi:hypothetical protein